MKEIILKLSNSGDLLELFKEGFISWTVLRDRDIYQTYLVHRQKGLIKTQAVYATAVQFDVDDRTIWRALSKMEE